MSSKADHQWQDFWGLFSVGPRQRLSGTKRWRGNKNMERSWPTLSLAWRLSTSSDSPQSQIMLQSHCILVYFRMDFFLSIHWAWWKYIYCYLSGLHLTDFWETAGAPTLIKNKIKIEKGFSSYNLLRNSLALWCMSSAKKVKAFLCGAFGCGSSKIPQTAASVSSECRRTFWVAEVKVSGYSFQPSWGYNHRHWVWGTCAAVRTQEQNKLIYLHGVSDAGFSTLWTKKHFGPTWKSTTCLEGTKSLFSFTNNVLMNQQSPWQLSKLWPLEDHGTLCCHPKKNKLMSELSSLDYLRFCSST